MQTFALPASFATARITDIILTNVSTIDSQGDPFVAAATVATSSGPSQFVLLGSGMAPDTTNQVSTTVVSGSSVPGQVSVALDLSSDSGVKGDDLTNVNTPTFDVTVNEPGTITIDYKGDGTSTATLGVAAAGTYTFSAPVLAPTSYTAKVSFTPTTGAAASATLNYAIDTTPPKLVTGPVSEKGPLYTRTLVFSQNIERRHARHVGVPGQWSWNQRIDRTGVGGGFGHDLHRRLRRAAFTGGKLHDPGRRERLGPGGEPAGLGGRRHVPACPRHDPANDRVRLALGAGQHRCVEPDGGVRQGDPARHVHPGRGDHQRARGDDRDLVDHDQRE